MFTGSLRQTLTYAVWLGLYASTSHSQSHQMVANSSTGAHAESDKEVPTQPQIHNIHSLGRYVTIVWAASSDNATPQEEIIYHIYSTEGAVSIEPDDLIPAGEVTGQTSFTIENVAPNTEIAVFVSAQDSAGNRSDAALPSTIKTGDKNVTLKSDLSIVHLSELNVMFDRQQPDLLIFPSRQAMPPIAVGDILIADDEVNAFIARVVEPFPDVGKEVEVRIEEISPFELILEGNVNLKFSSEEISF